jgi:hypothetical protein
MDVHEIAAKWRNRGRWRIPLIAAATAAAIALAGAPGAMAATKPRPPHVRPRTALVAMPITAARPGTRNGARQNVITCTPNVQNPHNSTHVPETVNVVVTISCTSPVTELDVDAALYRNGSLVAQSGYKSFHGASYAQNNAAVPCQNATYQGWGGFYVVFPPGYDPPTGSTSGFGNAVSITC